MAAHHFTFEGGEILSKMGASWFVSYAYYEMIDRNHENWARVATTQTRLSKYNKGRPYHKTWLKEVITMDPAKLNRNTIGLEAAQTKAMARKLLSIME